MRMLWAMCASAVAVSALTGVLLGVYLDGRGNNPKDSTPASTWVSGKPSKSTTTPPPPSSAPKNQIAATPSWTTTTKSTPTDTPVEPTRTTEPPPVAPPPPAVTTTTTTAAWPCSPLNPLPPPHCND